MRVDFFKIVHLQKILHFENRDNQISDYVPHSFSALWICTDLELSTLTDLLTDYAAPETPSIRRKATVRIKNLTSTAVSIYIYAQMDANTAGKPPYGHIKYTQKRGECQCFSKAN